MSNTEVGQKIITEVRRVANDNRNFVYDKDNCVYQNLGDDGLPCSGSCIMGTALWNLGYLPAKNGVVVEGKKVNVVLLRLGIIVSATEERWLDIVQAGQDGRVVTFAHNRLTWGSAVAWADSQVSLT